MNATVQPDTQNHAGSEWLLDSVICDMHSQPRRPPARAQMPAAASYKIRRLVPQVSLSYMFSELWPACGAENELDLDLSTCSGSPLPLFADTEEPEVVA